MMRSQAHTEEQDKICWVINLERKVIKLEFLDYKKYSSFTFVDPAKHLFGFTVLQPKSPTKVTNKLSLLEGSRFLTPTQNIEERTLKGSLDRYINLPSEHSKEKDTPIPIKKSLNLNENVPYRKISTSSAGSPHYHNQFGSKRQEIERRQGRPPTSEFTTKQHVNRTYKINNYFPAKKPTGQGNLNSSFNNSVVRQAVTDRSTPRSRGGLAPLSMREVEGQERMYKRVKDIIRK